MKRKKTLSAKKIQSLEALYFAIGCANTVKDAPAVSRHLIADRVVLAEEVRELAGHALKWFHPHLLTKQQSTDLTLRMQSLGETHFNENCGLPSVLSFCLSLTGRACENLENVKKITPYNVMAEVHNAVLSLYETVEAEVDSVDYNTHEAATARKAYLSWCN